LCIVLFSPNGALGWVDLWRSRFSMRQVRDALDKKPATPKEARL
jgi:hypothetical protein